MLHKFITFQFIERARGVANGVFCLHSLSFLSTAKGKPLAGNG
jgi:hypothetical protein